MTGGRTLDGGEIVGASVFYTGSPAKTSTKDPASLSEVEKLDQELRVRITLCEFSSLQYWLYKSFNEN